MPGFQAGSPSSHIRHVREVDLGRAGSPGHAEYGDAVYRIDTPSPASLQWSEAELPELSHIQLEEVTDGEAELPLSLDGGIRPRTSVARTPSPVRPDQAEVMEEAEPSLEEAEPPLILCPVPPDEIAAAVDAMPSLPATVIVAGLSGRRQFTPERRALLEAAVQAAVATHRLQAVRLIQLINLDWSQQERRDVIGPQLLEDVSLRLNLASSRPI